MHGWDSLALPEEESYTPVEEAETEPSPSTLEGVNEDAAQPQTLLVRATINLPGLKCGTVVTVARGDPYIEGCLKAGFLAPAVTA